MTKQEFESRIGGEVTPEEYDKNTTVYVHYPGIEDKDHIARLHTEFGMRIIDDMFARANTISDTEVEIQAAKGQHQPLRRKNKNFVGRDNDDRLRSMSGRNQTTKGNHKRHRGRKESCPEMR